MNLQDVLFGSPASLSTGTEKVILGPVTSEGANYSASVVNHAVESGKNVSDHVKNNPDQFSIKTILVDRDISDYAAISQISRYIQDTLSVSDKIGRLKKWKESGEMLKYSGPMFSSLLKTGYDLTAEDVVITGLGLARADSAMEVSISMQKVIIAKSMTKEMKLPQAARQTQNKGQTEKGKTSVTPKPKSILTQWGS